MTTTRGAGSTAATGATAIASAGIAISATTARRPIWEMAREVRTLSPWAAGAGRRHRIKWSADRTADPSPRSYVLHGRQVHRTALWDRCLQDLAARPIGRVPIRCRGAP